MFLDYLGYFDPISDGSSKFDVRLFEAKNMVFEFDYEKMNTFEFILHIRKMIAFLGSILEFWF